MPVTRARTSTSREPAVCPTYSKAAGTDCGCTVTTATSGAGMPACGCELAGSQPVRTGTRNAPDNAAAATKWMFLSFMSYSLPSVRAGVVPVQIILRYCNDVPARLNSTKCQKKLSGVIAELAPGLLTT